MTCPGCARENRAGARFCSSCGMSLAPRCPACGSPASPEARFCDACGAALAGAPAEKAIARKVVTVVFADLIGSMALHERRDAESARRVTDRYHRAMTAAVDGTVLDQRATEASRFAADRHADPSSAAVDPASDPAAWPRMVVSSAR